MSDEIFAPTREQILSWPAAEMLKYMKDPVKRAIIEQVWNTPVVDQDALETQRLADEAAAQIAASEAAAVAEEARLAAEAEAARVAALPAAPAPTKIIVEYQTRDENNNPIGRPTHLEADTWEEMSQKQQAAHENAVRHAEKLRNRKPTYKKDEPQPEPGLSDDEILRIAQDINPDPAQAKKTAEAVRKLSGADQLEEDRRKAREAEEYARGQAVSYEFMKNHLHDFNPCQANSDILTEHMKENDLSWTVDNLEIAFAATESRLARPVSVIVPPAANPPAQAPVAAAVPAAEVTVAPPAAAAPTAVAAPAVVANPQAPARRVPDGGLQPGQLTGRPTAAQQPVGLTKRDIQKMPRDEYKLKIKDPKFRAAVERLFAQQTTA